LIEIDNDLYEMKRAVAHLDLGLKAYRAAARDQIDASRLLEPIADELTRLIEAAERARGQVRGGLKEPVKAEG
jgi:hypothetical protein